MTRKSTRRKTTPKTPTSLDVLAAMLAGPEQDTTMQTLLPLAERELYEIVACQFDLTVVKQAAHRMVGTAGGAKILRAIDRIKVQHSGTDAEDALCEVEWRNAEAGFALGVLVGRLITGGVR
ncbi:MAG: hypothetical protein AB7U83_23410 [Vicinamibacterales bacterium]